MAKRSASTTGSATGGLKKSLGLLDVYAVATGATLSAGFFLLPGLAAQEAGPAIVLCYLLAAVPLIPAMLCIVELSTAMPRAGGAYYFLDRSYGPLVGTVGGMGTWLALTLKAAFALVGMGAYVHLFFPDLPMTYIGAGFAVVIGVVNFLGSKETGRFQIILVVILLLLLAGFLAEAGQAVQVSHFHDFFAAGGEKIIATAGLVYISYVGVTKVASIAEEVRDPERNLPLGVFLALGSAILIYGLGTFVMVGVVPEEQLRGTQTLVADTARIAVGDYGVILVTVAALTAFASVANAGILSSSRYPLAMSRDRLLPTALQKLGKRGTPGFSIVISVGAIVVFLLFLDPIKIAKLASAFQLLIFAILCGSVIVMRESRIASYDPGYRSPFYPYLHIFGIIAPIWLIMQMGWLPTLFTCGIIGISAAWYYAYARRRVVRHGAIYHVFERLGRQRFDELDRELRGILKEKGLRAEDPFDEVIVAAEVIDLNRPTRFTEVVLEAAKLLARHLPRSAEEIADGFMQGTKVGATPVGGGAALPHVRLPGVELPLLAIVRCVEGVRIAADEADGEGDASQIAHAVFFLVSPEENPAQHLRILAQIAGRLDRPGFVERWREAPDSHALKELLLRDERSVSLHLRRGVGAEVLIDKAIRDCSIPESCLVVMISRGTDSVVPRGSTVLRRGDRVTIIGEPDGISELYERYADGGARAASDIDLDKDRDDMEPLGSV
jgi:amino acid transporter/mannitol/fructose-specific phosphotransferase system IIA component (Ntr-type)